MNTFCIRFRELLHNAEKKQKEICKELEIAPQKLSKWKTGYNEPNLDDIIMLARYFDVSADYLLGRTDDFGNVTVKQSGTELTSEEEKLLRYFRTLSAIEREQTTEYVAFLVEKRSRK